ncbi:MAG: type II toxin-antitoxin system VapC family toxin [Xanthomonadales bacterium]|nr:type II toxin-antitoxin system VapC family toxin [Xanthomonadales bacterium]
MTGLDTNVLIRFLTQDDDAQAKIATNYIGENCSEEKPAYVCHVVLCELVWVLESNYQQAKETIVLLIEELLQISQLEIMESESVWRALSDFKKSNADFADHLVANTNLANGCSTTVTFDKKAGKQPLSTLLK